MRFWDHGCTRADRFGLGVSQTTFVCLISTENWLTASSPPPFESADGGERTERGSGGLAEWQRTIGPLLFALLLNHNLNLENN